MKLSKRMSQLSVSPTLALNAKAKALKAQGIDVLNFAVGEPDFGTPAAIVNIAIQALQDGQTRYGPAGGGEPLRQAIAAKLKRENQLTYSPADIVCGIGAKEILFHLFLALLNEGDEVLLSAPFWVSYEDQIKAAGGVPVRIPLPTEAGVSMVDPQLIEAYATPRTVGMVVCSPNNPAGYVLGRAELSRLGTYLTAKAWWVISDEVYEYMSFDGEHESLLHVCPALKSQFVLVNSLSKSFAMTGWRVGYTAGPPALMAIVRSLQSHSSTCIPPFIEAAATWAVNQGKGLLTAELARLRQRRDLAVACLSAIKGLRWIAPSGAFYVFVELGPLLKKTKAFATGETLAFCQYLLETHHLAVVPGEAFGAPGYIRFSYACDEATIREGFARLSKAVAGLALESGDGERV